MFRTIPSAIVAILAAAVFVPAGHAETGMVQKSVRVSYADLDLLSPAGARTLVFRLRSATRYVCGPRPTTMQLAANGRYEACMDEAMSRALAQINSPVVTAHLTGQTSAMSASR